METTNINGKIGLNNLYKFRTDRFLTKELKSRLIKMLEETTFIQNPCSNTPADFLKNLESNVVKGRVAWFGARMRANLAQVYSPQDNYFHKPNHDVALLLVIMSGRWRAHAKKTMQAHLNVTEINAVMEELGMTQQLITTRLKELEEREWITRVDSFADKRIKLVIPTATLINRQLANMALQHLIATATGSPHDKHLSKHMWGVMGYDIDLWHWAMKSFNYYAWGRQNDSVEVDEDNLELFNIIS